MEVPTPWALPLTKDCLCLFLTINCFSLRPQGSLTPLNYSPLFLPSLPVVQDVFVGHLLFAAYLSLPLQSRSPWYLLITCGPWYLLVVLCDGLT